MRSKKWMQKKDDPENTTRIENQNKLCGIRIHISKKGDICKIQKV